MTLTYSECESLISHARNAGDGKPLQNHTRLYQNGADFAVRLHWTDVVTIHPDGTYTLATGGWETVTTKDRINGWGPARVYSERRKNKTYGWDESVWCVHHASDPVTPAKVQKCRTCKGTGQTVTPAYVQTYGWLTAPAYEVTTRHQLGLYYTGELTRTDGTTVTAEGQPRSYDVPGQVVRHDTGTYWRLPEPVEHPAVYRTCYRCNGEGRRDYGSKPMPVIFFDGITVDSTGRVVGADAWPRFGEPAEVTAAKTAAIRALAEAERARVAAAAEAERREAARDFRARLTALPDGRVIVFKAVSDVLHSGWGFHYPVGQTVTAPDWRPDSACGHGLHFWPVPRSWSGSGRYLACAIDPEAMVVIDPGTTEAKCKAESCEVLYEVDLAGNRV